MTSARQEALDMVLLAADYLEPLLDRVVFVGGAVAGFLITDPAAPGVRSTVDVDVIVEVASLGDYHRLEDRLRQLGLKQSVEDEEPICRWHARRLALDVMPTDERILGFSNHWYRGAIDHAQSIEIAEGRIIRCVSAPYFVATKLEAFRGRGGGDVYASHDLEDVVALIDGRPALVEEIGASDGELRRHVAAGIRALLADAEFLDALPEHLVQEAGNPDRAGIVLQRLERIAARRRGDPSCPRPPISTEVRWRYSAKFPQCARPCAPVRQTTDRRSKSLFATEYDCALKTT